MLKHHNNTALSNRSLFVGRERDEFPRHLALAHDLGGDLRKHDALGVQGTVVTGAGNSVLGGHRQVSGVGHDAVHG